MAKQTIDRDNTNWGQQADDINAMMTELYDAKTALNTNVKNVETKMPIGTTTPIAVSWVSGYRNKTNGALLASGSAYSTALLVIDKSLNYKVTSLINGSFAAVVCYYNGTTFISSEYSQDAGNITYTDQKLHIPLDATHFAFCTYSTASFALSSYIISDAASAEVVSNQQVSISALQNNEIYWSRQNKLLNNFTLQDYDFPVTYINNGYFGLVAGSLQILFRTDFHGCVIQVSPTATSYKYTGVQRPTNICAIVYLDKNNVVLGRELAGTGVNIQYNDYALTVPANTMYIALCSAVVTGFNDLKIKVTDYPLKYADKATVETLSTSVAAIVPADTMVTNVLSEQQRYIVARNIAIQETNTYVAGGGTAHWYGVEFVEENTDSTVVTRISSLIVNDAMPLHNADTGLPIHSLIKRCVLKKDGTVNYYLSPTDSTLKADGTTASVLDGTDGDFCVEIPSFFYKIETEATTYNALPATLVRVKLSQYHQDDTWQFFQLTYTSAVEASVNWSTNAMASVIQTVFKNQTGITAFGKDDALITKDVFLVDTYGTNAANYRGAANNSQFDNTFNESTVGMPAYDSNKNIAIGSVSTEVQTNVGKYIKCGLGRPFSASNNRGRTWMRSAARLNTNRHNIYLYDTHKALYWLALVEFANRNLQTDINSQRTAQGYTQGGCGYSACTLPFNDYEGYKLTLNSVVDIPAMAIIPCGTTLKLGNKTGEVAYYIPYYPYGTGDAQSGVWTIQGYKPRILMCNSYRGVEHWFGHTYKITDQINLSMNQTYRNTIAGVQQAEYIGGSKANIKFYYSKYAAALEDKNNKFFEMIGEGPSSDYCIYYIQNLLLGKNGHILPMKTNGKSPVCYSDLTEFYVRNKQQDITGEVAYLAWAGRVCNNNFCGPLFSYGDRVGNETRASDTTRLDYR